MPEAENDPSSTFVPTITRCQAVKLVTDEPCVYAVYGCGAASTIIMEEHPTRSRKESGADPVALTKHYDEEMNESFTSDEEDYHPVCPEKRRLSTAPLPTRSVPGV
jgi:hypothetical protein